MRQGRSPVRYATTAVAAGGTISAGFQGGNASTAAAGCRGAMQQQCAPRLQLPVTTSSAGCGGCRMTIIAFGDFSRRAACCAWRWCCSMHQQWRLRGPAGRQMRKRCCNITTAW